MVNVKPVTVWSYQTLCLTALIVLWGIGNPCRGQADSNNTSTSSIKTGLSVSENRNSASNELGIKELFFRMMAASVVVAVLGIAVMIVSKKVLPKFTYLPNKRVKMLETLHIGPRKTVHLLEIGDRHLLIGSTSSQMVKLAEFTDITSTAGDVVSPEGADKRQT